MSDTDRIEKQILIKAPRGRVWQASSDYLQFGRWFGVELEGAFVPGATVAGRFTDAKYQELPYTMMIEAVEPERLFSFRWHPDTPQPGEDEKAAPTTLVEFKLAEAAGGTQLTIVESGFDAVPLARRAKAFRSNTEGWEIQSKNVERHVLASL